jgi:hypothetical protein
MLRIYDDNSSKRVVPRAKPKVLPAQYVVCALVRYGNRGKNVVEAYAKGFEDTLVYEI